MMLVTRIMIPDKSRKGGRSVVLGAIEMMIVTRIRMLVTRIMMLVTRIMMLVTRIMMLVTRIMILVTRIMIYLDTVRKAAKLAV